MKTRKPRWSFAATAPYRVLALLTLVAVALAVVAFFPARERIPVDAAPLETPVAFDEPVVHRYK